MSMHKRFVNDAVKARSHSLPPCYAKGIVNSYRGVHVAASYRQQSRFRGIHCYQEPSPGAGSDHRKEELELPRQQQQQQQKEQKERLRQRQADLVQLAASLSALDQYDVVTGQQIQQVKALLKQAKASKRQIVQTKRLANNTIVAILAQEVLEAAGQVIMFIMGPEEDSSAAQENTQRLSDALEEINLDPAAGQHAMDLLRIHVENNMVLQYTDASDLKAAVQSTLAALEPRKQEVLDKYNVDGGLTTAIKVLQNADQLLRIRHCED